MTGSGNDFVFLDGRDERLRALETPDAIRRLCARGTGVGADGVVWLMPAADGLAFYMRYRNSDGSVADMCGNAALCSISLATKLGIAPAGTAFRFKSDAGILTGRRRPDGLPEVELTAIQGLAARAPVAPTAEEVRIGYADTGVPHLIVEVADAEAVDLMSRGAALRSDPGLGRQGANVNFVSRRPSGSWRMRTFERGVEAETLACGTGAAACAAVLRAWGVAGAETIVETTSGKNLLVSLHDAGSVTTPSLAGEGRIVFEGQAVDP